MPEEEEETAGPAAVDEESSSSDRLSPMGNINIVDVSPIHERMTSTSSSSVSSVPDRSSKSPGDQNNNNNNTNELSIIGYGWGSTSCKNNNSTSSYTNTPRDERRRHVAIGSLDGSSLADSYFQNGRRRGSRQLTKLREMDKELAAWINGFHANDKLDELTREMITDRARLIAKQKKILDFSGTANWYTRFLGRNFSDSAVSKQLKMLSFTNPGKFMEDFDPERSAREMRKMNRRIYRENVKKNQMYDETGRLLDNSKDACDCLDEDCPGCHFPCPKCGSEKCGTECRCNRKWVYEIVEIEGTNLVINNPSIC